MPLQFVSRLARKAFRLTRTSLQYYYYIPLGLSLLLAVVAHFVFAGYESPSDEAQVTTDIPLAQLGPIASIGVSAAPSTTIPGRSIMSVKTRMLRAVSLRSVQVGFVLITLAFGMTDTLSGWMVAYVPLLLCKAIMLLIGESGGQVHGRPARQSRGVVAIPALRPVGRYRERTFAITMLAGQCTPSPLSSSPIQLTPICFTPCSRHRVAGRRTARQVGHR